MSESIQWPGYESRANLHHDAEPRAKVVLEGVAVFFCTDRAGLRRRQIQCRSIISRDFRRFSWTRFTRWIFCIFNRRRPLKKVSALTNMSDHLSNRRPETCNCFLLSVRPFSLAPLPWPPCHPSPNRPTLKPDEISVSGHCLHGFLNRSFRGLFFFCLLFSISFSVDGDASGSICTSYRGWQDSLLRTPPCRQGGNVAIDVAQGFWTLQPWLNVFAFSTQQVQRKSRKSDWTPQENICFPSQAMSCV